MLPILLIPGLNCSATLFANQIPPLWRFGSVVIANHTCGETVGAIAQEILKTAPPRFTLIGFSIGGYIAFEFYDKLASVSRASPLSIRGHEPTPHNSRSGACSGSRWLNRAGSARVSTSNSPWSFIRAQDDEVLRETYRTMAMECGADAFVRHLKVDMSRPDSRPDLARIRCPTTIIVGDTDQLTPTELAEEMACGIDGARLVIIPQSGHLSPLEQPTGVTRPLTELLQIAVAGDE